MFAITCPVFKLHSQNLLIINQIQTIHNINTIANIMVLIYTVFIITHTISDNCWMLGTVLWSNFYFYK